MWDYDSKFYHVEDAESQINGEYAAIPVIIKLSFKLIYD